LYTSTQILHAVQTAFTHYDRMFLFLRYKAHFTNNYHRLRFIYI